jgi:uncharacterized protein (DUF433 family)
LERAAAKAVEPFRIFKDAAMTQAASRLTIDPSICHGKPCIRGMRYPVQTVLQWLAAGMDIGDIIAHDPQPRARDIRPRSTLPPGWRIPNASSCWPREIPREMPSWMRSCRAGCAAG